MFLHSQAPACGLVAFSRLVPAVPDCAAPAVVDRARELAGWAWLATTLRWPSQNYTHRRCTKGSAQSWRRPTQIGLFAVGLKRKADPHVHHMLAKQRPEVGWLRRFLVNQAVLGFPSIQNGTSACVEISCHSIERAIVAGPHDEAAEVNHSESAAKGTHCEAGARTAADGKVARLRPALPRRDMVARPVPALFRRDAATQTCDTLTRRDEPPAALGGRGYCPL